MIPEPSPDERIPEPVSEIVAGPVVALIAEPVAEIAPEPVVEMMPEPVAEIDAGACRSNHLRSKNRSSSYPLTAT